MNKKFFIVIAVIIVIIGILFKDKFSYNEEEINFSENIIEISNEVVSENKLETNEKIKIHICGEVQLLGLIEIDAGSRIKDAIEMAGGITELANISKINLAYIVSDGEKVYIPSINDENIENDVSLLKSTKININIAGAEELKTLSGIGESTANSIIEYRNKNGKFSNIEDIKNVSGIGESKFEKIKDSICTK